MTSKQSTVQRHDAVLFDFDGVLVDSEPLHFECWKEILQACGFALEWSNYLEYLGIPDREFIAQLSASHALPFEEVWAEYPHKQRLFMQKMQDSHRMPTDVKQMLSSLRGSLKLAVVTSSSRGEVEPFLAAHGVRDCFTVLVCSEDVAERKPNPEPYRTAAKLLGSLRPLVVEDSPAGIASGRAAGYEVLVIPRPGETVRLTKLALARDASSDSR